ncbi:MAG: prolyl oligopeptidase family serine peptidase [Phycisphaerales bacterium]|nr:prolyl oligopeptidase family serine peptidase [Phycisphaerales bacterium]
MTVTSFRQLRPAGCLGCATALLVALATISGCTTFVPGDRDRLVNAAPAMDIVWPTRRTSDLEDRDKNTKREIYTLVPESDSVTLGPDLPEDVQRQASTPIARIAYTGVHGQGIIRQIEYVRGNQDWRARTFGTLRFMSYSEQSDRLIDPRMESFAQWTQRSLSRQLAGKNYGLKPNDPAVTAMLYEGTAIRVSPPPEDAVKSPNAGTIVHMSGLGSIEWEQPLLDEFQRRGWWVIRISTPRVWWYEGKTWPIGSRDEAQEQGRKIAAMMDDLVAEMAYSAEGVIDYLAKNRSEIPQHPLVMVGCSAGALGAPAVVARLRDKFDAAILVGGGANLLQISQTSDLTDAGIKLAWKDNQPRSDWRNQLFASYLEHAQLDPYRTAPHLRDMPVLVVHAEFDLTVPAKNGWLLWDRLGRPDRITHFGEHRTMFFGLGTQSPRIADWLDGVMARTPRP